MTEKERMAGKLALLLISSPDLRTGNGFCYEFYDQALWLIEHGVLVIGV